MELSRRDAKPSGRLERLFIRLYAHGCHTPIQRPHGFFEDHQTDSLLRHLPDAIKPVVEFAWRTGWRIASEVLPLEWRNVDFAAGEVRLDPGTTKNGRGRIIKMTPELRALLESRRREADALKAAGTIVPWVFWRMVPKGSRAKKTYRGDETKPLLCCPYESISSSFASDNVVACTVGHPRLPVARKTRARRQASSGLRV